MSGLKPVTIKRRHDWANQLSTLELDFVPESFTSGQFFNLGLEIDGKVVRRSYSAASAPGAPLEFFLSQVPDGELTPGVFQLGEGDSILLDEKALGFFTLDEVPETKTLWLVATGTGLGPYMSMLREKGSLKRFEQINVIHGVRHAQQLAYRDELSRAAADDPRIHYIPTLSGAEDKDEALRGRITQVFDSGVLEEKAGAFDESSHMLLCGNPQMIEDMVQLLKARGFEKHRRRKPGHFNFEKYW